MLRVYGSYRWRDLRALIPGVGIGGLKSPRRRIEIELIAVTKVTALISTGRVAAFETTGGQTTAAIEIRKQLGLGWISTEEWDIVRGLAVDIVNASGDEAGANVNTEYLDKLQAIGPADILAAPGHLDYDDPGRDLLIGARLC